MKTIIKVALLGIFVFSTAAMSACTTREALIGAGAATAGAAGGWYANERWGDDDRAD